MSLREEDRQKNSCPSRGLGIAAAAIGVGVGAALYYFFSKRQENPNSEGSTSDWNCERPQTFDLNMSDDSYTTVSEHETSDTSINDSLSEYLSRSSASSVISIESTSEEEFSIEDTDSSSESEDSITVTNDVYLSESTYETGYLSLQNAFSSSVASDSEVNEWDVTTSSLGVPEGRSRSPLLMLLGRIGALVSPRKRTTEEQQMTIIRQQAFRERSWTLEECSICFDVMLRTQEVTALPCSHNFHTECIMPWLQEKQTCPICRKTAE